MRNVRYIILILCLCPTLLWAQRRFSTAEQWEYRLAELSGFSNKSVNTTADILNGLHAGLYTGSHHLLGFSAEGAWSSMVSPMPCVYIKPGGGSAGFHLLYEYQYSGILVQTGLAVNFQRVTNMIADTAIYHEYMLDTWSGITPAPYTLRHEFENRKDVSQQLYGQFPLYIGHYILSPIGIGYFLVGAHVNYSILGSTSTSLIGSTSGLYERYVGVWEQMDNHGFRQDVPLERKGDRLQLKLDVMAHAEMGYEYSTFRSVSNYRVRPGDRLDCRLRLGAFVDFSMLNICPKTNKVFYDTPMSTIYDFSTYDMQHVFSTADAKKYWVRNMYVGLRFTVLFGFKAKEHCILCDPWRH